MRSSPARLAAVMLAALALAGCASAPLHRQAQAPVRNGNDAANAILFRAIALVGTPYRTGGNTPESGFDCSGLVGYIFRDVAGIALPRTAEEISRIDAPDIDRDALASGDLVFFHGHGRNVTHVGIYVGENRFVHAPNKGGTVRLDALDGDYWREHYSGAKRVRL
jgi:cell wall-associated NlpC family hydrolase